MKLGGLWPAILYSFIRILMKTIKININASKFQLVSAISHKIKPVAFYSKRHTYDQKGYTRTEKEALCAVKSLKELRTILLGQILIIYSDHKNLTCNIFSTDILLKWRIIIKEYGTDIEYIRGEKI